MNFGTAIGIGIGLDRACGPRASYDPNAQAFFTASGLTDPTAKNQWNDWFLGLKSLSLWPLLVEGWAYGSTHNPSSSTVYGMKRVADGTVTANVTQDALEMRVSTNVDRGVSIAMTALPAGPGFTIVEVGKQYSNPGGFGAGYGGNRGNMAFCQPPWADIIILQDGVTYDCMQGAVGSGFSTTRRYRSMAVTGEQSGTCIVDGSIKTISGLGTNYSAGGKLVGSGWIMVSGGAASPADISRSLTLYFSADISGSESVLRALYKSTIGAGQGLP